jgi:hypothetical protein
MMASSQNEPIPSYDLRRMAFVAAFLWVVIWVYVAWRGLSLIADAKRFISLQPPGGLIPQEILNALEIGQSYVLRAALFGAAVPIMLLIGYWIYRGFFRRRGH